MKRLGSEMTKPKPLFNRTEYQTFGLYIAERLNDQKNKTIYMKLAKTERREILEQTMRYVQDSGTDRPIALFLWKLALLKKDHKIVNIASSRSLEIAKEALLNDKVIIFPTDTVYSIGCRMYSQKGLNKLNKIKRRSAKQPTGIYIGKREEFSEISKESYQITKKLTNQFWPGQLTIITEVDDLSLYPKKVINQKNRTMGIRLPNYKWLITLIQELGEPIIQTSANFTGCEQPLNFNDLDPKIIEMSDLVIRDSQKKLNMCLSTIISVNKGQIEIVREGAISKELVFL